MIRDDKLNDLKDLYVSIAKDLNNKVDSAQLEKLINNVGFHLTKDELNAMLMSVKKDENGEIGFDEFVGLVIEKCKDIELNIADAFSTLDRNKNGYISIPELQHLFLCIGENYSIDEIKEIINELDNDSDGYINFQEFLKLMYDDM